MKTIHTLLASLIATSLLVGCSAPSGENKEVATSAPAPMSSPEASMRADASVKQASANGTIEAIDSTAKTITIAHGPVAALGWPAMTMTFQAPDVDLTAFRPGDRIAFEFSVSGMTATVTVLKPE